MHELLISSSVTRVNLDAVSMLISRMGIYEWDAMDQVLFMMESVWSQQTNRPWRRYVLASLFPPLVGNFRSSLEFRPTTRGWPERFARLARLRDELAKDTDPKLKVFMERFQNVEGGPAWERVKRKSAALHARMLKEYPQHKETWEKAWGYSEISERSQVQVADRLIAAGTRDKDKITPAEMEVVARAIRHTMAYRNRIIWGNMYRRVIQETLNDPKFDRQLNVLPIRYGWADYAGLEKASDR